MKNVFCNVLTAFSLLLITSSVSAASATPAFLYAEIPKPIRKAVKALDRENLFILQLPASPSEELLVLQNHYTHLERLATSTELGDLILTHPSAVVRLYAFKSLTQMLRDIPEDLMVSLNKDGEVVEYIMKDNREKAPVNRLVQYFLN